MPSSTSHIDLLSMKSALQATAWFLLTSLSGALPASHDTRAITTVAGSAGPHDVSIQFTTPCHGCFVNPSDQLNLRLDIESSAEDCGVAAVSLNGVPFLPQAWNHYSQGGIAFSQDALHQDGDDQVFASWKRICLPGKTTLLSVNINTIAGQNEAREPSGFSISFAQGKEPTIVRLENAPLLDTTTRDLAQKWSEVDHRQRVSLTPLSSSGKTTLTEEMNRLKNLKVEIDLLHRQYKHHEHNILRLIKEEFRACHGVRCFVQTALKQAPDVLELIRSHFRHHPHPHHEAWDGLKQQGDAAIVYDAFEDEDSLVHVMHDELDAPTKSPPPEPRPHMPPFKGEPPADYRPFDFMPPPSPPPPPAGGHHPGGHPPPPPPPDHHGRPWHHPPRPHRIHHRRREFFVSTGSLLLVGLVLAFVYRLLNNRTMVFRHSRRHRDRAANREERRNRRAYRRAACRHKWSKWWSRAQRSESTSDYDEKRARIIGQEEALEDVMQGEIRDLRRAHEMVGEIMRAEEGRQRMYHEANFGASSGSSNVYDAATHLSMATSSTDRSYHSLPLYQAPPPSYEQEIESDISVADGFHHYTPSNSSFTPESSVVDCRSRMSIDTRTTDSADD